MVTLLLMIIYISFVALGLPDSLLGGAWPLMHIELGASTEYAGVISFVVSMFTVFSSLFASRFLQQFGTAKVTIVSIFLTVVALMGYSLMPTPWLLIPCAVFLGSGAGAVDAALSNYVALYFEARHMNWLHCCWGVGAMCGTYVMAGFLSLGQWRWGFRTVALILAVIVIILVCTIKLWSIFEKEPVRGEEGQKLITNRDALKRKGVKNWMLAMLCYNGFEVTTGLWMATYFIEMRGMAASVAASCCSLFYIGITVSRIIAGALSARYTDSQLIRFGIFIAIAGIVLILLPLPGFVTAIGLFVAGCGGGPIYPCIVHATPQRYGEKYSSTVIGLEMAAAYVGSTCIPMAAGYAAGQLGMLWIPLILLGLYIMMLLAVLYAER